MDAPVTVVGAGLAGAACAVELTRLGRAVRLVERGRAPGGRMASPTVQGRRVDLGAGYFTVRDPGFQAVVDGWADTGLARPWTDTFDVLSPDGRRKSTGPVRWGTPDGLRSLVRAVLGELPVSYSAELTTTPDGPVVLAMPDPQAARIVGDAIEWVDYEPVIAVAFGFASRTWDFDAAFVNDDPDLSFVADDGSRRGDAAPVLVAHTTPALASRFLTDPIGAIPVVTAALTRLVGVGEPGWSTAHRWTFAKPVTAHDRTHHWDGRLGLAGDQWCPEGSPRVESAWRSGIELARAIAG